MAGTLIVSNLKTDTDNSFIVRSNTGTTLFVANTTGIDVANSFASSSITSDKILTVANTKISGNIISSQITSVANTQLTGTITGSQISSNTLSNTVFQTGSVENYMSASGLGFGMRNRIINGAMVIDQRNAGASVTPVNGSNTYPTDRWTVNVSVNSKITAQQNAGSVTPPVGFSKYLGITVGASSYSIGSTDYFAITQVIEGFNTADFAWGTANAKTITLSFQVYSSLTGTYGGALQNYASNRSYPFTYTISSANTWTTISITIAGDTTGTWLTTNSGSICLIFGLGVGSTYSGTSGAWAGANYSSATGATSLVGTANATWYVTGVQLEKGSTATSFDYRHYTTELQLCYRYYLRHTNNRYQTSSTSNGSNICSIVYYPVTMRTAPTFTTQLTNANYNSNPAIDSAWDFTNPFQLDITKTGTYTVGFESPTNISGVITWYGATLASIPTGFNIRNLYTDFSAEL